MIPPPSKTILTDKVLVRDWVKEKIGEEYLKRVYQVSKTFDDINFETLPEQFFMQVNNGSKRLVTIKKKSELLNNKKLYNRVKFIFDTWCKISYFPFSFEPQYKEIKPQIIIEELFSNSSENPLINIEVYCFNSIPKIINIVSYKNGRQELVLNEKFEPLNFKFLDFSGDLIYNDTEVLEQALKLSEKLSKDFIFVRVDFIVNNRKIYFNEMTFTPFSGHLSVSSDIDLMLGNLLKI